MQEDAPKLKLEEVPHLRNINLKVAKRAYREAEKRLEDELETKKDLESRALSLTARYAYTGAAILGSGVLANLKLSLVWQAWSGFYLSGSLFFLACVFSGLALWPCKYAYKGFHPNVWMTKGALTQLSEARLLVYQTLMLEPGIDGSMRSNDFKSSWLKVAAFFGVLATVSFVLSLILLPFML